MVYNYENLLLSFAFTFINQSTSQYENISMLITFSSLGLVDQQKQTKKKTEALFFIVNQAYGFFVQVGRRSFTIPTYSNFDCLNEILSEK